MPTGGAFIGIGVTGPTPAGNWGLGYYVDSNGDAYFQVIFSQFPGASFSYGYSNNLNDFLTGASVGVSPAGEGLLWNIGMNQTAVAVGAGTQGVTFTYGVQVTQYLPSYLRPHPPNVGDPIVLDLGGNGISLTSVESSAAYFDFTGSGFSTKTGWIAADQGLLVRESGVDPSSIDASEVFGATSGNAFQDLAALDSNSDGVVDSSDTDFGTLSVWVDSNGNGTLQSGELKSLSELGITSLGLAQTAANQDVQGNAVVSTAEFVRNSVDHTIAEVGFATNRTVTQYTPPVGFIYDVEAFTLPQLNGHGLLPSLWVKMSLDEDFRDDVRTFALAADSMSGSEFRSGFEALIYEWAGVGGIDPESRGSNVNAQHLAVAYAFYGIDEVFDPAYSADPNGHTGPQWEAAYNQLVDGLVVRFASQVALSQVLNGADFEAATTSWLMPFSMVNYDSSADTVGVNFANLIANIYESAPLTSPEAHTYFETTFAVLQTLKVDLFGNDVTDMAAEFVMAAEEIGISREIESVFFAQSGAPYIDEGTTSGNISTPIPFGTVVFLGTSDKTVWAGSDDILVYRHDGDRRAYVL